MDVSLARIETVNAQVNAIISLDAEAARDTAKTFDEQRKDIGDKPLYGLPIAIKDLVLTKGIRTTFGSPIYRDFVPDIRARQIGADRTSRHGPFERVARAMTGDIETG